MATLDQLQTQIQNLSSKVDALSKSPDISRANETALRERLGLNKTGTTNAGTFPNGAIWGHVNMVAGVATVHDSRIISTSTFLLTQDTSYGAAGHDPCAYFTVPGQMNIITSDGTESSGVYYLIIF